MESLPFGKTIFEIGFRCFLPSDTALNAAEGCRRTQHGWKGCRSDGLESVSLTSTGSCVDLGEFYAFVCWMQQSRYSRKLCLPQVEIRSEGRRDLGKWMGNSYNQFTSQKNTKNKKGKEKSTPKSIKIGYRIYMPRIFIL